MMRSRIRQYLPVVMLVILSGVSNGKPYQEPSDSYQSRLEELTKKARAKYDKLKQDALNERDRLYERISKELPDIDQDEIKKLVATQMDKGAGSLSRGAKTLRKTADVKDPGPALSVGTGGRVELSDLGNLERVISIGGDNLLPIAFLEAGVAAARCVGRVTLRTPHKNLRTGDGWGTGFLVGESLFLTNNHVIPDKNFARKVEVHFNAQNDVRGRPLTIDPFEFDAESLFVTDKDLDFTLIRLKPSERMRDGTLKKVHAGAFWGSLPLNPTLLFADKLPVNIIQHPNGRAKEIALQDNVITGIFVDVIRYTTDTEPGSSGSPVFNNNWEVIALHHAAGEEKNGEFVNNEGIRIDQIVQFLQSNLKNDPRGQLVFQELGL